MDEIQRARNALNAIDPACTRERWLRVVMAAKHAGLSQTDLAIWSAGAETDDGERDCAQVWRSISEAGASADTLYTMAEESGWKDTVRPHHNGHKARSPLTRHVGAIRPKEPPKGTQSAVSVPQVNAQRYKLLGSADLRNRPPLAWRIRGVLPAQGLASIFGPSSSGKSFLALDMAACMAEGNRWFDHRVSPCPVIYVALEGEVGFRLRVEAWEKHHGRALPVGLRLVMQPFKLTEAADVHDLAAAVLSAGDGAVTIIDTLNRAAPNSDENTSADMGRILEAAKELQRLTDGLVIVVHHTGKDAQKGLRGHSSLLAALDAAVEVTRDGDRRGWKVEKAKDGQDGATHSFRLEVVDLGLDADGEPITSCAVEPVDRSTVLHHTLPPKSGNQRVIWNALGELLRKAGPSRPEAAPETLPAGRPAIKLDEAVEALRERLAVEPKRKTERTQKALTGLQANRLITIDRGFVWVT